MHLQSFAEQADLLPITQALWQHKIPHRVRQVNAEQQLWLQNASQADAALAICAEVLASAKGDALGPPPSAVKTSALSWVRLSSISSWLRQLPVTGLTLGLVVLVAIITQLGASLTTAAWLTFYPLIIDTQVYLVTGYEHLWRQPWRLISPILLHFGWLHIVFNSLWWLDLGRRIEAQSRWVLVMLLLLTGLAGNLAQAWQGASLFGGLSGVIYGLLGYIYIIDRFNPQRYYLPQSILLFMLLWLILGLTDVLSVVGFGSMANMAHLGGLLAGVGFGLLHTLWLHKSRS
jgi:GlpG protein